MLESLETLLELKKHGSMVNVATSMRLSQSTVSKRISSLEQNYGYDLVERDGRNIRLTYRALVLLEQVEPLLAQLRDAIGSNVDNPDYEFRIGVSESILSSWGARELDTALKACGARAKFHCHRSPLVVDHVESGKYDLGVCAGKPATARSLLSEELFEEEMVLVGKSKELARPPSQWGSFIAIEQSSATWKALQKQQMGHKLEVDEEVESFFSVAQLACAGRGIGLVPLGVANALKFSKSSKKSLKPRLYRPIQLVYKKSRLDNEEFSMLLEAIRQIRPMTQ